MVAGRRKPITAKGPPVRRVFPISRTGFATTVILAIFEMACSKTGLSETEVDGIMGGNWLRFYDASFGSEGEGS